MNLSTLQRHTHTEQGFTLVELIVALAMMGILMSVVTLNQRTIADSIRVKNSAYELALALREAQSYGINVRQAVVDGGEVEFIGAYGIVVENDETEFFLYYDKDDNQFYESAEDDLLATYSFQKGQRVGEICVVSLGGGNCNNLVGANDTVDISFIRPSPTAIIKVRNGSQPIENITEYESVTIPIETEGGGERSFVTVSRVGKVSVDE